MSRYKTKGYPWSSGLGVSVEDCTTSAEVMEKAKLDFVVDKCPIVAKMPFRIGKNISIPTGKDDEDGFNYGGNIYREVPRQYATYRNDINVPLGLVKEKYEVVQNIDAFNFFDEAIGENKAIWQTAGAFGLGHKVFISAKLPITTTVNGNDPIENYLVFSNSHDGSSSINIMFTPIRVFCTNCLNSALKNADSYIRIKHTRTAKERLQEGAEILKIACQYAKDSQELYNALFKIGASDLEVKQYFARLVLTPEEYSKLWDYGKNVALNRLFYRDYITMEATGISTRKANRLYELWQYYLEGVGQSNIVGTAWGAYNAVTGFYSNVDNKNGEARMQSLLYGTAQTVTLNALNSAFDIKAA